VRFVVDKVALRQVSLRIMRVSLVHVIPPNLQAYFGLHNDKLSNLGNLPESKRPSGIWGTLDRKSFTFNV
jgi:hypothetical protein